MPLRVVIVGAGIAGLACAIALGREGHRVDIYEKSRFANEIGAAYHSGPYAVRILKRWGVDLGPMRAVVAASWDERDCEDPGKVLRSQFVLAEKRRQLGIDESLDEIMHHRVDAHRTLREHALALPGVRLHLSSPAAEVADAEAGTLVLESGERVTGDVIIGADGIHSRVVAALDADAAASLFRTGVNMYRFMVPTAAAMANADLRQLLEAVDWPCRHSRIVHAPTGRSLVMYACRDGELINCATFQFAGDDLVQFVSDDYTSPASLAELLHLMHGWPPAYRALAALADDIKHWAIIGRDVPGVVARGRVALAGDAAHPTQPTWAAGANMGVEDAAVLGVLLDSQTTPEDVPRRLQLYHRLRYERIVTVKFGSEIQTTDRDAYRAATDARIRAKCGAAAPGTPDDMVAYLWSFDAVEDAQRALAAEGKEQGAA